MHSTLGAQFNIKPTLDQLKHAQKIIGKILKQNIVANIARDNTTHESYLDQHAD